MIWLKRFVLLVPLWAVTVLAVGAYLLAHSLHSLRDQIMRRGEWM